MFCRKCGSQNTDDARFCEKCGAPFTSPGAAGQPRPQAPAAYSAPPPAYSAAPPGYGATPPAYSAAPAPYSIGPGRDVKPLVAGILAGVAVVLILVANLGHSWFKRSGGDHLVGLGLWSLLEQDEHESETTSFTSMKHPESSVKRYIYTSMPFYVVNWLVLLALAVGAIFCFLKYAGSGHSPTAPLLAIMIPTIAGGAMFLIWLFGGAVGNDSLNKLEAGISLYLWVLGEAAAISSVVLIKVSKQA